VRRHLLSGLRPVVLCGLGVVCAAPEIAAQSPIVRSHHELLELNPESFVEWLKVARPAPLSAVQRAVVLAALPAAGTVTDPGFAGRLKLKAMSMMLNKTGRNNQFEVRVVDVPVARVGVAHRTVILISRHALNVLTAEELQAIVAHEIGHEYFETMYSEALAAQNYAVLKEVELLCDAVAVLTMQQLGIRSTRLIDAVEKLINYNRETLKRTLDERGYPTVSDRRAFVRAVFQWRTGPTHRTALPVRFHPPPGFR
jgi:hypothetical protein